MIVDMSKELLEELSSARGVNKKKLIKKLKHKVQRQAFWSMIKSMIIYFLVLLLVVALGIIMYR